jgi:hypothetical protein
MLSKGYEYAHFLYYHACMYQIEQLRVQILVEAGFSAAVHSSQPPVWWVSGVRGIATGVTH